MTDIYFVNYYQWTQTMLQNKETAVQSYRKMSNQNIKKSAGIEDELFNCTREMGMDNFGCQNSSLTNLRKKVYDVCTLPVTIWNATLGWNGLIEHSKELEV